MPIPLPDPNLPGLPVDPTPIPTPVPTPTPTPTPAPANSYGGIVPEGELPWVTQQRAMLMGIADRDNWPDWIRASYNLPPRVEGAAPAPYIEELTNQQRRAQQIQTQGARLAAYRAANPRPPRTPGGGAAPVTVPGLPPMLANILASTPAQDAYAAPPGVANQYPLLSALSSGGDFADEIRKGVGGVAAGGGAAGGGLGSSTGPASGVPSTSMIAPPRRGLFS